MSQARRLVWEGGIGIASTPQPASTLVDAAEAMDKPRFDDETGAALNAAAERLVQRAKAPTCDDGPGTAAASGAGLLSDIPIVDIAIGKHKYVQIELTAPGEAPIRVVRSYAGLSYHADNYERAMELLHNDSSLRPVRGRVIGGGRIEYRAEARAISVYGYSKSASPARSPSLSPRALTRHGGLLAVRAAFGRAKGCNEHSCELIRANYPDFDVSWSDKGY